MNTNNDKSFEDQDQQKDIIDIHDASFREKPLQEEGMEQGPWWLYAVIIITFAFGFFYIGFYWGEFSYQPHVLYQTPKQEQIEEGPAEELSAMALGEQVYGRVCTSCHQNNGMGAPGAYPPLANTDYVTGDEKRLAAIILHGLVGEIEVDGEIYDGNMPAWGEQLSDEEVAGVLTYIRSSFGNEAPEVAPETVTAVRDSVNRTAQWTVEELNNTFRE
ncbi:MAG: c-type cytochrome [Bacteroidota bacterium]